MKVTTNGHKARPARRKKPKAVNPAKEIRRKLNSDFRAWFRGPKAKIEHDLNIEYLTDEALQDAKRLVRACAKVGAWRLKQGELSGDARFYAVELAEELAQTIQVLIGNGDVMLARWLPPIVARLQNAMEVYGAKLTTGRIMKRPAIEQLLKKHKARELLPMVSALHPDWHTFLLHIYNPKIQRYADKKRHEILLRKRRKIESYTEERLRGLLLSEVCWIGERDGKRTEEWRKHGLAETIESMFALRESENKNINCFAEYLWQGHLWSGPGRTFEKCPWHGQKGLPVQKNVAAWMKIVMPFLRRATQDDAMKLGVFKYLLATRKAVFVGDNNPEIRLADDKADFIWNQVRTRLAQAWKTMASRAHKRKSKKPA